MYLKAGTGSGHIWKCELQYMRTDSWKNYRQISFSVLLLKRKNISTYKLEVSCLPTEYHKWKCFHNGKAYQNMFHIWRVQIQRKQSLQLTVTFWVGNFLMSVCKFEMLSELKWVKEVRREWNTATSSSEVAEHMVLIPV